MLFSMPAAILYRYHKSKQCLSGKKEIFEDGEEWVFASFDFEE